VGPVRHGPNQPSNEKGVKMEKSSSSQPRQAHCFVHTTQEEAPVPSFLLPLLFYPSVWGMFSYSGVAQSTPQPVNAISPLLPYKLGPVRVPA